MQVRGNYLFNINASYDIGAKGKADYPKLPDLLSHMDRLGIDGAAVHSIMARDFQPTPGNRKLMDDIENTPGAKERLFPVFCIAPAMYYNAEEYKYLMDMVSSGRVKVLAAFHNTQGFRMREISRLLNVLRTYKPAVLVEYGEYPSGVDLLELEKLAIDFPDIQFIIRTLFWAEMHIADVMWKCPNVGVESSWLFSSAGLKLFTDNYGPERIFFGADIKNHQASSIASLEYAEISGSDYELISGGNAKRILCGAPGAEAVFSQKRPPARFDNSFWQPFIERRGLRGETIIDAHAHGGTFMPSCYTEYFDEAGSFEYMSRYMERIGVSKTMASSIGALKSDFPYFNRLSREAAKPYGDKFAGYYAVNPHQPNFVNEKFFEEEFARGYFIGFKVHPVTSGLFMVDSVYKPMLEFADRHRMPVQMHCACLGLPGSPDDVEKIAGLYKNVRFILGHGGFDDKGRVYAEYITKKYDNIFIELCASFCVRTRQLEETVREVGADRVVFGSDGYGHDLAYEFGSLLSHDLTDEQLRLIFGGNMKRILDGVR